MAELSKLQAAIIGGFEAVAAYRDKGEPEVLEHALVDVLDALVGVPGSSGHMIDEMWAWVMFDASDGNEGIPAVNVPGTELIVPLVGADADMAMTHRDVAIQLAAQAGARVELRRFTKVEVLEVIES